MSPEELTDLAAALGQLRPTAAIERDRLLYEAGRAAAPAGWKWPLAAGVTSLLAVILGLVLVFRPAPAPEVRFVRVPAPPGVTPPAPPQPSPRPPEPVQSALAPAWSDVPYYRMQEQIAHWGLDAVPPPVHGEPPPEPESVDALLKSYDVESLPPK